MDLIHSRGPGVSMICEWQGYCTGQGGMKAKVTDPVDAMCYSEEDLIDYHLGDRSPEEREAIRAHVHGCGRCAAMLLDISDFFRPAGHARPESVEEAKLDWQEFDNRMEWKRPGVFGWIQPWSLLLGAALAGFGLWIWMPPAPAVTELLNSQASLERQTLELKSQLTRQEQRLNDLSPQSNVLLDVGDNWVRVPEGGFIELALRDASDAIAVEVRRADGTLEWRHAKPRPLADGTLKLVLHRSMLPDGDYQLLLEKRQATRKYRFRVATAR
jgi:hypothetical protein